MARPTALLDANVLYLHARGLSRCRFAALRFHPELRYREGPTVRRFPALVAAVTGDDGRILGVQRTWLDPRSPAKAGIASPRKALGRIHGLAVRFGAPSGLAPLVVGEGIETVLSLVTAVPEIPAAAALSAGSLGAFAPLPGLARLVSDRRDALEIYRDCAADAYRARTGEVWRPRHGSHTSRNGHLTSAAIDARDFMRARKDRKTTAHLPDGTLIAIAGGKDVADPAGVISRLDKAREKYADMVLVHGGGPGVEKIAASWAERNGVHQVVCKPDWDRHGRAAPFRRNDELLNLLPKGVIAFPGSGITENLVDKARTLGIPVQRIAA